MRQGNLEFSHRFLGISNRMPSISAHGSLSCHCHMFALSVACPLIRSKGNSIELITSLERHIRPRHKCTAPCILIMTYNTALSGSTLV
jgi:hypothetical protein